MPIDQELPLNHFSWYLSSFASTLPFASTDRFFLSCDPCVKHFLGLHHCKALARTFPASLIWFAFLRRSQWDFCKLGRRRRDGHITEHKISYHFGEIKMLFRRLNSNILSLRRTHFDSQNQSSNNQSEFVLPQAFALYTLHSQERTPEHINLIVRPSRGSQQVFRNESLLVEFNLNFGFVCIQIS